MTEVFCHGSWGSVCHGVRSWHTVINDSILWCFHKCFLRCSSRQDFGRGVCCISRCVPGTTESIFSLVMLDLCEVEWTDLKIFVLVILVFVPKPETGALDLYDTVFIIELLQCNMNIVLFEKCCCAMCEYFIRRAVGMYRCVWSWTVELLQCVYTEMSYLIIVAITIQTFEGNADFSKVILGVKSLVRAIVFQLGMLYGRGTLFKVYRG